MTTFLKKHWFFVGMAVVSALAFAVPELGVVVKEYKILNFGIFLTFLITGLSLDTRSVLEQIRNVRVLSASLLSALVVIPIITAVLATLFFGDNIDFIIGSIIIAAAPVTVASGTVMTAMALGNVPLSLFICVLCNLFSLISIPLVLNWLLGFMEHMLRFEQAISLPVGQILITLSLTVLVPTVLGQIMRPWLREQVAVYKKAFSIFSQCVVLLIIFNAVSSSVGVIGSLGLGLVGLFGFMIFLHVVILALNYGISKAIRLDEPSTAAFTIHTSQKTLTISYLVWAGYFAHLFPLAMVPGIVYHVVQMIMDTFVAQWFRERAGRRQGG
ncbi:Predicted Na+-dependent transporter [Desulfonatronum thiosulfatophilum]|uniref:Predicted Na+-dependent transporter n=1 Tax=Desulfonatronum thiosulfatophilum TaxID=617002 RepID=A0A1G6C8N4_9BACT|nr:bile acid:sodium symporter [Desulfonatronum thiosulfatophilum]SDB29217.1 Predicted Na+-dependent transporter [Desulfonatronum thiosulfatophilum]